MNRMTGWALRFGTHLGHLAPADAEPAPLFSDRFASGFLTTMRPYLLFVSGITGLLGMALAPAAPLTAVFVLALVFFLLYGFGQALTDVFQTDTDALSSPYRPLVRGEIRPGHVLGVSLVALLVCGWVLFAFHPANLVLAAVEIAGLVTYTWMKRRWWGGPPHNSWIVAGLVVMGFLAATGAAGAAVNVDGRLALAAVTAFLGYAHFVVAGYHKDVEADRVTGYVTLPVRFGRKVSARVSDALALGAVLGAAGLVALSPDRGTPLLWPAVILLAAGAGAFLVAGVCLHRSRGDDDAHRAIAPGVLAYVLCLAAAIVAHRPEWTPLVVLYPVFFALSLRARPMREQI